MQFFKKFAGLFFIIILSFLAIQPFFVNGFFPIHDDTQVVRVSQMAKALSDGHIPARWTKDLGYGYGYPLFNFYAPLPYYVGGLFNLLGMDALGATKAMMVVGILLAGIFMYVFAKEIWGEVGGITAGAFYIYAPYHAVDIYVRGAVGEFWAYAFLPLLALGFYKRSIIIGSLGFAGVVLSHNLTAFMLVPFLLFLIGLYIYTLLKKKQLYAIRYTLYAILLGLGISAFYWIPAIWEMGYTNVSSQVGGGADFRDHFVCLPQLWDSMWGYGGSAPGCNLDGLSFKIGKLHIVGTFLALIGGSYIWKRKKLQSSIIFIVGGLFTIAIFFMLDMSKPLWETFPFMSYIQYPWRFLIFASFFSSFLIGSAVWIAQTLFKHTKQSTILLYTGTAILLFLLVFFNSKIFQPRTIDAKTAQDYTSEANIKWTTSKISDEYMPKGFIVPKSAGEIIERRIDSIVISQDKTQRLLFSINPSVSTKLALHIAPFPSWQVFIDGEKANTENSNKGIIVAVPMGNHTVDARFEETLAEKIGNIVSIMSIIAIFGILWNQAKKHEKN